MDLMFALTHHSMFFAWHGKVVIKRCPLLVTSCNGNPFFMFNFQIFIVNEALFHKLIGYNLFIYLIDVFNNNIYEEDFVVWRPIGATKPPLIEQE